MQDDSQETQMTFGRLLLIVAIGAFVIWVGSGCHMARIKSLDLDMGGLEIEYYEPPPHPPDAYGATPLKATPASWGELMPMEKRTN